MLASVAPMTPDIVTMNNAHPTHYSDNVEPGVKFVLRGWDPAGGVAAHHLDYRDVKVHNVPRDAELRVATLKLESMGLRIDRLTREQREYLTSWHVGT